MKKIYTLLAFTMLGVSLNAATINVSITNTAFTPSAFSANVGDVVVWTWDGGFHSVTGLSIPGGATTLESGQKSSGTYSYTITVAGTYGYWCSIHTSSMVAGFSVTATGISEPTTNLITSAYPNPFKDKLTFKFAGIESIQVFNIIGEKVKALELSATESKVEVDFANLPSGIYFYRTYKDGIIVETKKIVKTK